MKRKDIEMVHEHYFCIMMDKEHNGPVIVASPNGGVDIGEVAEKTPDRIMKLPVSLKDGLSDADATKVAQFFEFDGELKTQCAKQVKRLYETFLKVDCLQYAFAEYERDDSYKKEYEDKSKYGQNGHGHKKSYGHNQRYEKKSYGGYGKKG